MRTLPALLLATIALVLSACGGGGSSGGGGASSSSSSVPSVDTLVTRATGLKISSMNADIATSVPASAAAAAQTVAGSVSMQLQPTLAGTFRFTVAGQTLVERIVGKTIYLQLPGIAAHDGGKPWVAFDIGAASAATGIDLNELLQDARNADPTATLRLLAAKRIFHETGTQTIDGQKVVVLTGSFTPATLPEAPQISAKLQAQLKAKLTQLGATREDVTTYLSFTGQPVKIVTTIETAAHGAVTSTVTVHAINIPVVVAAPPAGQTITLAQLQKLAPPTS